MTIVDETESLREQITQLEREVAAKNQEITQLRRTTEVAETPVALNEFEDTLKRLVQRIAMILQAEKCAVMILDKETGELVAKGPAFGMTDRDIRMLRVRTSHGIAGEVFRSETPVIFNDASSDPRALRDHVEQLKIRNGVIVP